MRALLVLVELWAASEIILLVSPLRREALIYAAVAAFLTICSFLTFLATRPPHVPRDAPIVKKLLPLQIAAILLVIVLTAWMASVHAHVLRVLPPLWATFDRDANALLTRIARPGLASALRTFIEYTLLPLVVLAALRVPFTKMGLGGFSRGSGRAAVIWLVMPVFALAYVLLYADIPAASVGRNLVTAFLAKGFSEEFLFRGALLGRLRSFMPGQWATFAQAIVFALWHFGIDVTHAGGNAITALALLVPAYAVFGFAMALLARRTGNLALPALFHTAIAALRGLFAV